MANKRRIILGLVFSLLCGAGWGPGIDSLFPPDITHDQTLDVCDVQAALVRLMAPPGAVTASSASVCDLQRILGESAVPDPSVPESRPQPELICTAAAPLTLPLPEGQMAATTVALAASAALEVMPDACSAPALNATPPGHRLRHVQHLTSHAPPVTA